MKNRLKTLATIVVATIAPALISTSTQAWNIYGYDFGDTYIQNGYDWYSGDSFTCHTYKFGDTDLTNCY